MKSFFLTIAFVFSFAYAQAQTTPTTKWERRADFWTQRCIEKFELDPSIKDTLYTAKLEQMQALVEFNRAKNDLSKEEVSELRKEKLWPKDKALASITGLRKKDIGDFTNELRPEMNQIK
ncbi:hypothetical protein [Flammeovirga sp. EKP202]|uniref:hypothetical protein n=1 Tax=Flammeovirga sp. EKP202 TaxID=2770592 RepID=UPI00165F352D|nr:hypothetical protein [Flammeovirga sp. EKP202]MBD0400601.1 hypothetical protein [Flammeovirga sp. EKP202]